MTDTLRKIGRGRARTFAAANLVLMLTGMLGLAILPPSPAVATTESSTPAPPDEAGGPTRESPDASFQGDAVEAPPSTDDAPSSPAVDDELMSATLDAAAAQPSTIPGGTSFDPITVAWAGGNDPALQQWQPDRAKALPTHADDFADLQVTVDQTQGLIDQTITVTISGMAPTVQLPSASPIRNFVQLMQCWGPDPSAPDFAETCQYGANSNAYQKAAAGWEAVGAAADVISRGRQSAGGPVRFRSVQGLYNEPEGDRDGLARFFVPETTNEVPVVRIGQGGRAEVSFLAQSAASQPYLGCGDPASAAGSRCWLVIVPRGAHFGGVPGQSASDCMPSSHKGVIGGPEEIQIGSPLAPECGYFEDRIVVPLDFAPAFQQCAAGSAERRIVGTDLATTAIGSWQSTLCTSGQPVAYSLSTNSGTLNRSQLLTGSAGMALTTLPVTAETVDAMAADNLDAAELAYAPLLNTGLVLAFTAEQGGNGPTTDIKLTPRLIAKLLTQSYAGQMPYVKAGPTPDYPWYGQQPQSIQFDPEWLELGNPFIGAEGQFVTLGPQGDDAIRLLWQWIQADAKAVEWLSGQPDNVLPGDDANSGMKINPYYLPSTNPNAAGGGLAFDLSKEPIDKNLRADQSQWPKEDYPSSFYNGRRLDSIAMLPYTGTFEQVARRVARADGGLTNDWDPFKTTGGVYGDFVSRGPIPPGLNRAVLGPVDAPTAELYGLAVPSLQLPNQSDRFVLPTEDAMVAAVSSSVTDEDGVAHLDFSALADGAYPLTTTIYAAVDLNSTQLTQTARDEYAKLLRYAASEGNIRGPERGQLPGGYVPLNGTQIAHAQLVASKLDGSFTPAPPPATPPATGQSKTPATSANSPAANSSAVSAVSEQEVTLTAANINPAQIALGGALGAGALGSLAAVFLLRRRPL